MAAGAREFGEPVNRESVRGRDHGMWVPLLLAWPEADIPVAQISLIRGAPASRHFGIGQALRGLLNLGLTDAIRAFEPDTPQYTYWDYQAGAWPKNNGIRIDHALLSPQASDRLLAAKIHRNARGHEKPSDHVPLEIELKG